MTEENKIKNAIRESLMRGKKIFEDRDEAIKKITSLFKDIQDEVDNSVVFDSMIMSSGGRSSVFGVFASNGSTNGPRKLMLRYSFGNPNAFPMEIDVPGHGTYACADLAEVNTALEEIVTVDEFILKIISISHDKSDDVEIPF